MSVFRSWDNTQNTNASHCDVGLRLSSRGVSCKLFIVCQENAPDVRSFSQFPSDYETTRFYLFFTCVGGDLHSVDCFRGCVHGRSLTLSVGISPIPTKKQLPRD